MNKKTKKKGKSAYSYSPVQKWLLPTYKRSRLKWFDRDTLNKYAKMYKIKPCKGCKPYTDKELIRELSKFIPSDKIHCSPYGNLWISLKVYLIRLAFFSLKRVSKYIFFKLDGIPFLIIASFLSQFK